MGHSVGTAGEKASDIVTELKVGILHVLIPAPVSALVIQAWQSTWLPIFTFDD